MIRAITNSTSSALQQLSNSLSLIFRNQFMQYIEPSIIGSPTNSLIEFIPNTNVLNDYIWLAVPKRKVSPGKRRMKTTNQKRIKTKSHVIVDKRTGEVTLRHRLPFNWKSYLPGDGNTQWRAYHLKYLFLLIFEKYPAPDCIDKLLITFE